MSIRRVQTAIRGRRLGDTLTSPVRSGTAPTTAAPISDATLGAQMDAARTAALSAIQNAIAPSTPVPISTAFNAAGQIVAPIAAVTRANPTVPPRIAPQAAPQTVIQPTAVTPLPVVAPATSITTPPPITVIQTGQTLTFDETADIELIENTMSEYGDTWDNPTTVLNEIYATGVQPGDVTLNMVLNYLTDIGTTTGTLSNLVTDVAADVTASGIPTWAWVGGGVMVLFLVFGGKHR